MHREKDETLDNIIRSYLINFIDEILTYGKKVALDDFTLEIKELFYKELDKRLKK